MTLTWTLACPICFYGDNMKNEELIKVYVKIEKGQTVCICKRRGRKKCRPECEADMVTRDRMRGWEETMKRDKYGK